MDEETPKKFSYPNVDQTIPGVKDANRDFEKDLLMNDGSGRVDQTMQGARPVVHILDALNQNKNDDSEAKTIRTFQADIADAIKTDQVSMIHIALAEKKRQERQGSYDDTVKLKDTNKTIVWVGVFAIIFVIASIAGIYFLLPEPQTAEQIIDERKAAPLMYAEQFVNVDVDNRTTDDLVRLLKREKDIEIPLGAMKGITLTTTYGSSTVPITGPGFFDTFNTRAPDGIKRSVEDKFMFGIYAFSPYDTFVIFKINSYDTAFASMLEWERFIETDVGDIFINKKKTVDSTSSTTQNLFRRVFVDKTIDNKDVRMLVDNENTPAMLYSFLDKETLIIASSEKSLKEIMFRLTAGKIVR